MNDLTQGRAQGTSSGRAQEIIRRIEALGPMPLTRGFHHPEIVNDLAATSAEKLMAGALHPHAAMAALWLAAGEWDQAHELANLGGTECAYVHAILHRMEPDAANSKYWLGQVGQHPLYAQIGIPAYDLDRRHDGVLGLKKAWDPSYFVDVCERVRGTADEGVAREVQQLEWRMLLAYCLQGAES